MSFMPLSPRHVKRSRPRRRGAARNRCGATAVDLIVVVVLVILAVLVILMLLPRGREHARMAGCQRNLAHVGFALALYDQIERKLPAAPGLAGLEDSPPGPDARPKSPLRTLLETLEVPDLLGVTDPKKRPEPRSGQVPGELPVPGFTCGSDRNATAVFFPAPISYRACTGDLPGGSNGAFAPGKTISLSDIQERDGTSYTAGFSERLLGDNLSGHPAIFNYMIPQGRLAGAGCPEPADASRWRGDAGRSWFVSDYRSTLYNHALAPFRQPSCIDGAGQEAFMGASSGHVPGVNLLLLDGRVTVVKPTIDLKIWREFARIGRGDLDSQD